jgi:hypothetical protein
MWHQQHPLPPEGCVDIAALVQLLCPVEHHAGQHATTPARHHQLTTLQQQQQQQQQHKQLKCNSPL